MYVGLPTSVPIAGDSQYAKKSANNISSVVDNGSGLYIYMVLVISINNWLINNDI